MREIQAEQRTASEQEKQLLMRWSGWGACPQIFADTPKLESERQRLRDLLSEQEFAAARQSTLNAHYTDLAMVDQVWQAAVRLGFTQGRVLEPGCGKGNFFAYAPAGAQLVGVERDPTAAAIAEVLYPEAHVLCESFARTRMPADFDLVVGNVPFGQLTLSDPVHNPHGHRIHNHFILKGLHLLRPGGLMLVMTSRYTMDQTNPAVRREIAGLADLVGAVRQASGAHRQSAGTDAVVDVLVLRRREADREPHSPEAWERVVTLPGTSEPVNPYWLEHADQVLGQMTVRDGLYRGDELCVDPPTGTSQLQLFRQALHAVTDSGEARDLIYTRRDADAQAAETPVQLIRAGDRSRRPEGFLAIDGHGFTRVHDDGGVRPHQVPAKQAGELRLLLQLRDTAMGLLESESVTVEDTDQIEQLRADLNDQYATYARTYGPINRFTWGRTGKVDPDTGEERLRRNRPKLGGFRTDPFAPLVQSLEEYDPTTGRTQLADIFDHRVLAPRPERLGADTPEDAIAICLDRHAELRLDVLADLLGVDPETARSQLGNLAFDCPESGRLVPAAEYLSGNVRQKLMAAEQAAAGDHAYAANVASLREVIPRDLTSADIRVRLGAAWIDASYIEQFLREIFDDPHLRVRHPGGALWEVEGETRSIKATSQWGTSDYPGPRLAEALLQQRSIQVWETVDDRRVFDAQATEGAMAKAEQLQDEFRRWLWSDPERAAYLVKLYNATYNAIVMRTYDEYPLSLPGLAKSWTPHAHQKAAVARIINEPTALLAHEVGAGKTAEMAMGAMELRRLGLAQKPCITVPNHMLEQFQREFLEVYPQAKVLAASSRDLQGDQRRQFIGRVATNDWDAIILTHTAFGSIGVDVETQRAYLDHERGQIQKWLENARENADSARMVKRIEKMVAAAHERMQAKIDKNATDPGLTWEHTGIDYLMVDEAHLFKNLRTTSNIPGAEIMPGSDKASDLDMKLMYLRNHTRSNRVATFATATPLLNSISEMHVMMRYLRPDLHADRGLDVFDVWANTFANTVTAIEVTPDGGRFRMHTRFATFTNVPELLQLFWTAADVKTSEDLGMPTPKLAGGQAETVVVPRSDELDAYVQHLGDRADTIKNRAVDPEDDNMLKVSGDGRKAALDLRLVGARPPADTKLVFAADRIAQEWERHRDDRYQNPDGTEHPVSGSLQLVFCDVGTPSAGPKKRWNAYDELRALLVARGVPDEQIRYIHSARNDAEKGELFAACRNGTVQVLLGSTEKMGVGTNVQRRAVVMHHLDCPWRPGDLRQREGRILRQGNDNNEVTIVRYVSEGSFDAFMWQTIARKAAAIDPVMRGRNDIREIEDLGDAALDYNEVKAISTGQPLLMDKAAADAEVTQLRRRRSEHTQAQWTLQWTVDHSTTSIQRLRQEVEHIDTALSQRRDTAGDAFVMTVGGTPHYKRSDAGEHFKKAVLDSAKALDGPPQVIGQLGGFNLTTQATRTLAATDITIAVDVPDGNVGWFLIDEVAELDANGLVTRLENRVKNLDKLRSTNVARISDFERDIAQATERLGESFPQQDDLDQAERRLAEIDQQIAQQAQPSSSTQQTESTDHTAAMTTPTTEQTTAPSTGSAAGPSGAQAGGAAAPVADTEQGKENQETYPDRELLPRDHTVLATDELPELTYYADGTPVYTWFGDALHPDWTDVWHGVAAGLQPSPEPGMPAVQVVVWDEGGEGGLDPRALHRAEPSGPPIPDLGVDERDKNVHREREAMREYKYPILEELADDLVVPSTGDIQDLTYLADGTRVVVPAEQLHAADRKRQWYGTTIGKTPRPSGTDKYAYQAIRWDSGYTDAVPPQVVDRVAPPANAREERHVPTSAAQADQDRDQTPAAIARIDELGPRVITAHIGRTGKVTPGLATGSPNKASSSEPAVDGTEEEKVAAETSTSPSSASEPKTTRRSLFISHDNDGPTKMAWWGEDDPAVRQALEECGFVSPPNLKGSWHLPQAWSADVRERLAEQLWVRLHDLGRKVEMISGGRTKSIDAMPEKVAGPPIPKRPPPAEKQPVTIKHSAEGTTVHNTTKDDLQVRQAIKEQGFRWSKQGFWFLPRPWRSDTRYVRARGLHTRLRAMNKPAQMYVNDQLVNEDNQKVNQRVSSSCPSPPATQAGEEQPAKATEPQGVSGPLDDLPPVRAAARATAPAKDEEGPIARSEHAGIVTPPPGGGPDPPRRRS